MIRRLLVGSILGMVLIAVAVVTIRQSQWQSKDPSPGMRPLLVAVEPDGTIAWKRELKGSLTEGPLLYEDGTVLVSCGDLLTAFDGKGRVRWTHPTMGHGYSLYSRQRARKAWAFFGGSRIFALDSAGQELWSHKRDGQPFGASDRSWCYVSPGDVIYEQPERSPAERLDAIGPDGKLFAATVELASDSINGWFGTTKLGAADGTLAVLQDGHRDRELRLYGATGDLRWKQRGFEHCNIVAIDSVSGQLILYEPGYEGQGELRALDFQGNALWDLTFGGVQADGGCFDAAGTFYARSAWGKSQLLIKPLRGQEILLDVETTGILRPSAGAEGAYLLSLHQSPSSIQRLGSTGIEWEVSVDQDLDCTMAHDGGLLYAAKSPEPQGRHQLVRLRRDGSVAWSVLLAPRYYTHAIPLEDAHGRVYIVLDPPYCDGRQPCAGCGRHAEQSVIRRLLEPLTRLVKGHGQRPTNQRPESQVIQE